MGLSMSPGIDLSNNAVLSLSLRDLVNQHGHEVKNWELRSDHLGHTTPYEKDVWVLQLLVELAGLPPPKMYWVTRALSWWTATYLNVTYDHAVTIISQLGARTVREAGFDADEIPGISVPWLRSRSDKPRRITIDGDDVSGTLEYWDSAFSLQHGVPQLFSFGMRKYVDQQYHDNPNFAGVISRYKHDCAVLESAIDKRLADLTRRLPQRSVLDRGVSEAAFTGEIRAALQSAGRAMSVAELGGVVFRRDRVSGAQSRALRRRLASMPDVVLTGNTKRRLYIIQ